MKRLRVVFTEDALCDLEELFDYLCEYDSPKRADDVLGRIEGVCASLAEFPERGSHPKELEAVGFTEYREKYFKPYPIIYRVNGGTVYIYLVTDGRRDMATVLERRLLRAR